MLEEDDKVELEDGDGEPIEGDEALEMLPSAQAIVEPAERDGAETFSAGDKVPQELQEEEEEDEVDAEDELTWPDVGLSIGAEIVNQCRRAVEVRLGYTCSAGVSANKVRSTPLLHDHSTDSCCCRCLQSSVADGRNRTLKYASFLIVSIQQLIERSHRRFSDFARSPNFSVR